MQYVKAGSLLALSAVCVMLLSGRGLAENPKPGGNVSGTVVDASGTPIADADVRVTAATAKAEKAEKTEKTKPLAADEKTEKAGKKNAPVATVKTDASGAFKVDNIPAGKYAVSVVTKTGRARERVEIKPGETVTVSLKLKAVTTKKEKNKTE